jgi:hypothetical protein
LDYYSRYDSSLAIIKNAARIVPIGNIRKADDNGFLVERKSFLENYISAIEEFKSRNIDIKTHYKLLIFVFQVRNNIFHGKKKAQEMKNSGQRERLIDYSYIILATVEMFFDILNRKFEFRLSGTDELMENAGLKHQMV